jgi:hypothetical protein
MWISETELNSLPLGVQKALKMRFWFEEGGYLAPTSGFILIHLRETSDLSFSKIYLSQFEGSCEISLPQFLNHSETPNLHLHEVFRFQI